MDSESHSDNDDHIIDITNDEDSSSRSSLDERSYPSLSSSLSTDDESSDEGASSSTRGCGSLWNIMELVVTLVQIVASLIVLTLAKDEHQQALLLTWVIGYTCGCITITLLILLSCVRKYNRIGVYSKTRTDRVMDALKMGNECFFVVWLVMGILWICYGHSSSSDTPKLYRLYSVREGIGGRFVFKKPSHDDSCCICLGKYGEEKGVGLRKLECSHVFHSQCIDKWLKIKSTCPLCESQVRW
ncbi:putative transcription factor C2H2 family [Arabidopsis thaliana]